MRTSCSAKRISPSVGSTSAAITFRIVDLPQPEGPISATSSPCATVSDTWSSTGTSPLRRKRLRTRSTSTNGCSATPRMPRQIRLEGPEDAVLERERQHDDRDTPGEDLRSVEQLDR